MKQISIPFMMCGTILALLLAACAWHPQPVRIEEIAFQSGEFTLVGELRTPAGTGPFPVVLFVHGDAPGANRTFFGMYLPIMERMLRAGYAVFSWDNPGFGKSAGTNDRKEKALVQVPIVMDAIGIIKRHSDINPRRIGLWGVSMAGWVMPRVLMASDDIAFMICQSCGSMSGPDEFVFLTVAQGYCGGVPEEDADQLESLLTELDEARTFDTYEGYLRYREVLDALPACDLLVIDEIGPLEIQMGKGLTNAMTALRRVEYHLAIVSLRPSMIEWLLKLLPGVKISVYWLDKNNRNLVPESTINGYEKDEHSERFMLIKKYDLEVFTPPCEPGAERYAARARLIVDISDALPYLNSTLRGAVYHQEAQTLTWKKGGHNIAFHAYEIATSNVEDRVGAEKELKGLIDLVNRTWERRADITPDTTTRQRPTSMAIFKLLPQTNCKQCGEPTCYTFALKLAASQKKLADCPPLFEPPYVEKLVALEEIVIEAPAID